MNTGAFQAAHSTSEQLHLVSMNVYPTRDYHDQWRRNYTLQMNGNTEKALMELVAQRGPSFAFSNAGISQVNSFGGGAGGIGAPSMAAGGLLRYSANPTSQVAIANGWGTRRCRFELTVVTSINGKPQYQELIIGHSDHYGAIRNGLSSVLDPNMIYTIDSIVRQPIEQTFGVAGMQATNQIGSADVIVTNQSPIANPFQRGNNGQQYVMRPQDVFTVADSMEVINGTVDPTPLMTQNGLVNLHQNTYIADTTLSHMAKPSNRRNDLMNSYTSRLLTNMHQTTVLQASPASNDFMTPQSSAMLAVRESVMSGYGFPFCLTRLAGGTCSTTGQFTQAELLRLDATIDSRTTVFGEAEDGLFVPPTCDMANASATNDHAIIAAMASNTTLALMNTHGFMKIGFTLSNFGGYSQCVVDSGIGPTEHNREVLTNSFQQAILLELGSIIQTSAAGAYRISVSAEAFNLVYVTVRLNGEVQEAPFVFPAWASASNTPIVSNDFNQLSGLANTVNGIVAAVTSKAGPGSTSLMPGAGIIPGAMPAGMPQIVGANGMPMVPSTVPVVQAPAPQQFHNTPPTGSSVNW